MMIDVYIKSWNVKISAVDAFYVRTFSSTKTNASFS